MKTPETAFDFNRPLPNDGRGCPNCNYPFNASRPGKIKAIECPDHMPPHWKHKIDKAIETDIDWAIEEKRIDEQEDRANDYE